MDEVTIREDWKWLPTPRSAAIGVLLLLSAVAAAGQTGPVPRFEDYPVTEIFTGIPAAPQLITPEQRSYRTVIRNGVFRGGGVMRDGKEQAGPNFAGQYIIVQWACGSPCGMAAIVDARSGHIYHLPFPGDPGKESFLAPLFLMPIPGDTEHGAPMPAEIEFRRDSSLMIIKATPDPSKDWTSYTHYYLWRDHKWTLLRKVRLEKLDPADQ